MAPRNKVVMAGCFDQHEVAAPRTLVFDSPREVEAATNLSFPCVIKPADSSGSRGVSIVQKNEDLAPALIRVQSQPKIYGIEPDKRIVVQDFVAGAEFSVESVTQGGTVTNVCVTRKVTTSGQFRVEIGHNLPAELDVDSERLLLAGATQAVTAVGIRNGVSHTELILTPDRRCFVLEVAARIGAGRIGAMVDQALGINLAEASVRVAIGEKVDTAPRRHSAAASRFVLAPRAGRLVALEGMPPQGPDVMISAVRHTVGSVVSGPESNRCRIAHFVTHGPDELVVSRRADALLQRVAVTVDPVQESSSSTSGHVP